MGKTELVQQKAVETGDNYFTIDVTNFAKGLYFVEISGNESRINEKLMIAK
jgi:hypothetical protein